MKRNFLCIVAALALGLTGCTKDVNDDGGGDDSGNSFASGPCGGLNLRVVNGEQCQSSASPVVVIIASDEAETNFAICTGTMITSTKVLTAAHCTELPKLTVAVGDGKQTSQAAKVIRTARHPRYRPQSTGASPYDISVLTLDSPLTLPRVPLLLSRTVEVGERVAVYGYGNNEDGKSFAELSFEAFKAAYLEVSHVEDGFVGAMFDTTKSGACHGDSGGPLIAQEGNGTAIAAVVLGGTNSICQEGTLEVFTSVQEDDVVDFIMGQAPGTLVR